MPIKSKCYILPSPSRLSPCAMMHCFQCSGLEHLLEGLVSVYLQFHHEPQTMNESKYQTNSIQHHCWQVIIQNKIKTVFKGKDFSHQVLKRRIKSIVSFFVCCKFATQGRTAYNCLDYAAARWHISGRTFGSNICFFLPKIKCTFQCCNFDTVSEVKHDSEMYKQVVRISCSKGLHWRE